MPLQPHELKQGKQQHQKTKPDGIHGIAAKQLGIKTLLRGRVLRHSVVFLSGAPCALILARHPPSIEAHDQQKEQRPTKGRHPKRKGPAKKKIWAQFNCEIRWYEGHEPPRAQQPHNHKNIVAPVTIARRGLSGAHDRLIYTSCQI